MPPANQRSGIVSQGARVVGDARAGTLISSLAAGWRALGAVRGLFAHRRAAPQAERRESPRDPRGRHPVHYLLSIFAVFFGIRDGLLPGPAVARPVPRRRAGDRAARGPEGARVRERGRRDAHRAAAIFANWHAVVAVVGIDHRDPDAIVGLWRTMLHGIATGHGFGAINTLTPPNYGHDAHAVGRQVPDSWWWHVVAHHVPHLLGLFVLLGAGAAIIAATLATARTGDGVSPPPRPGPSRLARARPAVVRPQLARRSDRRSCGTSSSSMQHPDAESALRRMIAAAG